ncbi:CopD family protein [soil metagenome]
MNGYAIVKALHIVFMTTWFAGLFYLPRLFVYHAMADDSIGIERFKIMERKLFFGIMTPGAILTVVFGLWLIVGYGIGTTPGSGWLHAKLAVVALVIAYHAWCGKLMVDFKFDRNTHSHKFYRLFNEVPVLFLLVIVLLVVGKPF